MYLTSFMSLEANSGEFLKVCNMQLDILIHDTTVITMDEQRRVLYHASIGIDRNRIHHYLPSE